VIGFTILAIGIAMIVLPGPAIAVIPIGLALLATEFIWAKKLLVAVQDRFNRIRRGN
jgi:tellurite resistance protein TerC